MLCGAVPDMGREHYIGLSKKRRRWRQLHSVIEHEAVPDDGALAPFLTERERRALKPERYKLSSDLDAGQSYFRDPETLLSAAHKLQAVAEEATRPVLNQRGWIRWGTEVPDPVGEQTRLYAQLSDDLQAIIETCEEAERQGRAAYWIVSD